MPKGLAGYFFRITPRIRSRIGQFLISTSDHLKARQSAILTASEFVRQAKDRQGDRGGSVVQTT